MTPFPYHKLADLAQVETFGLTAGLALLAVILVPTWLCVWVWPRVKTWRARR